MPFAPDLTPDVPPPPLTVAEKYALDEAYLTEVQIEVDVSFIEARWLAAWRGWDGTIADQQALRDRFAALGIGARLAFTLLGMRVGHLMQVLSLLPGHDAFAARLSVLGTPTGVTIAGDGGTPFKTDGSIGDMTFPTSTDAPPA